MKRLQIASLAAIGPAHKQIPQLTAPTKVLQYIFNSLIHGSADKKTVPFVFAYFYITCVF